MKTRREFITTAMTAVAGSGLVGSAVATKDPSDMALVHRLLSEADFNAALQARVDAQLATAWKNEIRMQASVSIPRVQVRIDSVWDDPRTEEHSTLEEELWPRELFKNDDEAFAFYGVGIKGTGNTPIYKPGPQVWSEDELAGLYTRAVSADSPFGRRNGGNWHTILPSFLATLPGLCKEVLAAAYQAKGKLAVPSVITSAARGYLAETAGELHGFVYVEYAPLSTLASLKDACIAQRLSAGLPVRFEGNVSFVTA